MSTRDEVCVICRKEVWSLDHYAIAVVVVSLLYCRRSCPIAQSHVGHNREQAGWRFIQGSWYVGHADKASLICQNHRRGSHQSSQWDWQSRAWFWVLAMYVCAIRRCLACLCGRVKGVVVDEAAMVAAAAIIWLQQLWWLHQPYDRCTRCSRLELICKDSSVVSKSLTSYALIKFSLLQRRMMLSTIQTPQYKLNR